jgi:hypothetical protein
MYGGKFLANGADTCVYDPPVSCDPPTPGMNVQNKVSRIVSVTSGEREKQELLKKVLNDIQPVFPRIREFVNFATDSCTPKFKPEDEQQSCKLKKLESGELVNLITPKQGKDFYRLLDRPDFKIVFPIAMKQLVVAMSYLNEYGLMHTDLHAGNVALMNGRLVAHDWGRCFDSRDEIKLNSFLDWAKRSTGIDKRPEYKYIIPILENTKYFKGIIKRNTKEGKEKLRLVLTRSWDTLALIGTSEYDGLITAPGPFLRAFVGIVNQDISQFSNNLRKIIPLAYEVPAVPVAPVAPVPMKVKKTRKVKSKTKKTRKSAAPVVAPVVPPVVPPPAPVVAPVVPPVVAPPVEPPKSLPKSMYVSPSVPNQEVAELRKDIEVCDEEVDELRKKVQNIAELTKLGPRRGGSIVSSKFDRCVKSVRKTVKARKGSNKESAAIGICTKSVLQTRGRTLKRYRKGRLTTQKLRVLA